MKIVTVSRGINQGKALSSLSGNSLRMMLRHNHEQTPEIVNELAARADEAVETPIVSSSRKLEELIHRIGNARWEEKHRRRLADMDAGMPSRVADKIMQAEGMVNELT